MKLVLFDISALFTSIPVPEALKVTKERLSSDLDETLNDRALLSADRVIELLQSEDRKSGCSQNHNSL